MSPALNAIDVPICVLQSPIPAVALPQSDVGVIADVELLAPAIQALLVLRGTSSRL